MIAIEILLLRLSVAALLGGIIGVEREVNNRPAGFRTHILVALGSCLIMIISVYGFIDRGVDGAGGEPARLAAQVVSGIGFLGAGTILRDGTNVRGLTTAASLWLSGGIGLAVGVGFYGAAIFATLLAIFSLLFLRIFENRYLSSNPFTNMRVEGKGRPGFIGEIGTVLGAHQISIRNITIHDSNDSDEEENRITLRLILKVPGKTNPVVLYEELEKIEGIEQLLWNNVEVIDKGKLNI